MIAIFNVGRTFEVGQTQMHKESLNLRRYCIDKYGEMGDQGLMTTDPRK